MLYLGKISPDNTWSGSEAPPEPAGNYFTVRTIQGQPSPCLSQLSSEQVGDLGPKKAEFENEMGGKFSQARAASQGFLSV